MKRKLYVGLDVGSTWCHVVAMDEIGSTVQDLKFRTCQQNLIQTVRSLDGEVHVNLEASELSRWIRGILQRCPPVTRVVVSDPTTNAWIGKDPLKSDERDARKLADLLRLGRVHEVKITGDDDRALFKQSVQHYDDISHQTARAKVRIKSRLRTFGVLACGQVVFSPKGKEAVLQQLVAADARAVIEQLYAILEHMQEAKEAAYELMRKQSQRFPEVSRFLDVPGIGVLGACRFSAYIYDPHRFPSKQKLWRYCRLGITDRSSDDKPIGHKHLDRRGVSALKDLSRCAYNGAVSSRTENLFQRTYHDSVNRTKNKMHARLSVQRKIVTVLWTLWRKNLCYTDNPENVNPGAGVRP